MRIATWNVNSIRARVDRVTAWLERSDVDVLAMQETKCKDAQFPVLPFEAAGYEVVHHGLNQWNGVAIASRVGVSDVEPAFPGQPGWGEPAAAEARALGATCGGVRVWSLYVPNGREVADPHYVYKLGWLAALRDAAKEWTSPDAPPTLLVGDWNVAPRDEDVWDPAFFEGRTHVTAPERDALTALEDVGFTELTRAYTEGQFTYWDYTQLRFPKRQGMRIDLAYGSPSAAAHVVGAAIDREERKGKGASDHAPVVLELDT
ncbi:MAG TPA: exodeoxyribonuclease III [Micrococcales bacterium]|uniref:Exodeoxyribonuclease III n=1 Tax=Miniimonas arenae TaxID=676201 RepID=A0A5C5BFB2_9MICO|nr:MULTISPECIES: exodeoxyribonuclease III [Miniimonas]TNU76842.1 exodeoxyribonuclease III [Miniimonas arenae]HCX84769.1 exodeoxyribonuclease III [Micrococcales bacterium]